MKFEDAFLDDLRDRVPITDLVGQRVTWDRKKSNPRKRDMWSPCPFHGEKSASFHAEDAKGRYHCFGCGASGNHFKFLMELDGVSFPRAVEIVADLAGVRLPGAREESAADRAEKERRARERERRQKLQEEQAAKERAERVETVKDIWQDTRPLTGTLGQTYFEWRGLPDPRDKELRFHPGLKHPEGGIWPCVVARVANQAGKGVGIWRIYLAKDGRGKALVASPKLGLGPTAGGAVRLGGMAKRIGLAEGIETARAVVALGASYPVWAGLSTSGIMGFQIPDGVEEVIVYLDPDGSKWKRDLRDPTKIHEPPGQVAAKEFVLRNHARKITIAEAAFDDDYLTVWQKSKGLEVR